MGRLQILYESAGVIGRVEIVNTAASSDLAKGHTSVTKKLHNGKIIASSKNCAQTHVVRNCMGKSCLINEEIRIPDSQSEQTTDLEYN